MTNTLGGVLYVGVTNDLIRRVYEHKNGLQDGFTKKYNLTKLVYYETHQYVAAAIQREKTLKHWERDWTIRLIEKHNPQWKDLGKEIWN